MTSKSENYSSDDLVEQYKIYVQDVGNIGERHENTRRFYLSVISALFVFLSMAGGKGILSGVAPLVQLVVGLVGIGLCEIWRRHMLSFGALYKAKFDVLREIEDKAKIYPVFKREKEKLDKNPKFLFLTKLDSLVPRLFAFVFVIVLILKWVVS